MNHKKDLSLVVACYNEGPIFEDSVRQVVEILDSTSWSYELIFVEDCSQDTTRALIRKIMEQYSNRDLRLLEHETNQGRGRTVSDGFRIARGDIVGYIDIDLETPARYIPSMVLAIRNGADVASAHRMYQLDIKILLRALLSKGYIRLVHLILQIPLKDTEAGYKFFRQDKLIPLLDQTKDPGWFWDTEIMTRAFFAGYKIVEIPCLFIKRYDKKSTVRLIPDTLDYLVKLWKFQKTINKLKEKSGPVADQ